MPTYVILARWTDQGIRNAKETVDRAQQARQAIERAGGRFLSIYWTQGAYDVVGISEFPDDLTATAALIGLGMQGNVRTETLRAFDEQEMQTILQKLP